MKDILLEVVDGFFRRRNTFDKLGLESEKIMI